MIGIWLGLIVALLVGCALGTHPDAPPEPDARSWVRGDLGEAPAAVCAAAPWDRMAQGRRMFLPGDVKELQPGALLAGLVARTEDLGEAAGFVRVVKEEEIKKPEGAPEVDLDWQSYAGKKRQLPWFLLSALLLAQNGIKLFMHGTEGHTPGLIYTREALEALGIEAAQSMDDAATHIRERNFA